MERPQQFKILKMILKIHYFSSSINLLIFSIDFAILSSGELWKGIEILLNRCFKIYGIKEFTINSAAEFVSIFSDLKIITDQNIILIFDEFDNVFNLKKEEKDSFLSALRDLKNDKDKHNIMVKKIK